MIKRALDIFGASVGLVLFAPVMAYLAWRIRREMGSPVIFRQTRPGKNGCPFEMIKFRTMKDGDGTDADRMTPLGAKLRSTSLDELPELWNVLKGEMSLVGPRPLLMEYLPLYSERQARRHDVRPGVTGWAQINGRNAVSWPEKFEMDVCYVENRSLWLDLKILFLTVWKVIRRDGISATGEATTAKFTGDER